MRPGAAAPGIGVGAGSSDDWAALTADRNLAMRVISIAIRGATMFPPQIGPHAEDTLLEAWAEELRRMLANLRVGGRCHR